MKSSVEAGVVKHQGAATSQLRRVQVIPELLLGTWINTNRTARGIVKVILAVDEGKLIVNAFGACDPSPCNWGKTTATVFDKEISFPESMALSAFYDFGFMETYLLAHVKLGVLVIAKFDHFKDGSGRSNYFSRDFFYRIDT